MINFEFLNLVSKRDENEDEEKDNSTNMLPNPYEATGENVTMLVRSKTMPSSSVGSRKHKESNLKQSSSTNMNTDRLKMAKEEAEKAIKVFQR